MLAFGSANAIAEVDTHSMESYTTCAVYHRMLAGAYKRENQSALVDLETEEMNEFIVSAKRAAEQTFGAETVEQQFLEAWRADTQLMESQINGNYKNVLLLHVSYKKRCEDLQQ